MTPTVFRALPDPNGEQETRITREQEKQMTREQKKQMTREQKKQMTRKEREELEEDMIEAIFIPLPFTTKIMDSPPYKSSDPEWQAFVKVSKDWKLRRSIQDSLADLVRKAAQASPALVQRCGADMKLGRYWLEIHYPNRPPPVFVHKGLAIGDYGVSIVEEPIDTVAAVWLSRALYPTVLTESLWAFSATLMKQNAANLAKLLGYDQKSPPPPPLQQATEKVQQIKKQAAKSESRESGSLSSANAQASDGSSAGSSSIEKKPAESSPAPGSSPASPNSSVIPILPGAESGKPRSAKDMYGIKHTQGHTSGAWSAFKQKFGQTWRPMRELPPRGAILVNGLVEISTKRAFITVDCSAWWDPKTKRYDPKTASFRLRSLRMKNQAPSRR
ncbi:hypothetical protein Hte_012578 [Hypoxylon texense]